MVADVLFPVALRRNLSYRIGEGMVAMVAVGVFVRAPIGNRTFLGVVLAIHASGDSVALPTLKFITSIETHIAPVSPQRIMLWNWISEYYMCSLGEVMKASLMTGRPVRELQKANRHPPPHLPLPELSASQTDALGQIITHLQPAQAVLLTGARAKTDIYLHLLQHVLSSGKSVLFLLPEIGVGEQFYQQLKQWFGEGVFLFHSARTQAQRHDIIQQTAHRTEPFIVVGLRSALLLFDLAQFGLIIVDEEHDIAYKQTDPAPRFHARDLAIVAGRHYHIPVLLGSSCASLESQFNARTGKYHAVHLDDPTFAPLQTEVVDTLRSSKKKQMAGMVSHALLHALTQNLARQKQALLFCKRCAGLQEELQPLIPAARIARLDEPNTPSALRRLLQKFAQREIDLLIGTQTIHKGLAFDNIGVVGILEADKQLHRQDFRAHERAYQIFTMLSHRMEGSPLVVIQAAQADYAFFDHFKHCDTESFVLEQLQERKDFGYPPFTRLIALRFKHRTPEISFEAAQRFADELPEIGITRLNGPFAPFHAPGAKLHTHLLWVYLPRHTKNEELKKALYRKVINCSFPGGVVQVDVDPY